MHFAHSFTRQQRFLGPENKLKVSKCECLKLNRCIVCKVKREFVKTVTP